MSQSAPRYHQNYDQVKKLLEADLLIIKNLAHDTPPPDQGVPIIILSPDQKKLLATLVDDYEKFILKLSDLSHSRVDYNDNFAEIDKINLLTAAHVALKEPSPNNIRHFQMLLTCQLTEASTPERPVYIALKTRGKSNKWYSLGFAIVGLLGLCFTILTAIFTHGLSLKAECTALKVVASSLGVASCFLGGASLFFFTQAYNQYRGALLPTAETEGEAVAKELQQEEAQGMLATIFPRAGGR